MTIEELGPVLWNLVGVGLAEVTGAALAFSSSFAYNLALSSSILGLYPGAAPSAFASGALGFLAANKALALSSLSYCLLAFSLAFLDFDSSFS